MLFNPLEEQLDLPATTIEFCERGRWQSRVVGQEGDAFAGLVLDDDTAQRSRIALLGVEHFEHADLIAEDGGVAAIDWLRVAAFEAQAPLGADQEEAAGLVEGVQAGEVQIAAVQEIEGAGLRRERIENANFVRLAVADVNESREGSTQVEQRVQLDSCLGRPKRCPRVDRQTQIDGRRIEA